MYWEGLKIKFKISGIRIIFISPSVIGTIGDIFAGKNPVTVPVRNFLIVNRTETGRKGPEMHLT